jgi:hypothetical protein
MDEHTPSGKYRLRVKLWEGSRHVVWRGVAEDSDDPVVVKQAIDQKDADRIRNEAAMGERLRGLPGVREVLGLEEGARGPALRLAWVDGETLTQWREESTATSARATCSWRSEGTSSSSTSASQPLGSGPR